MRREIKEAIDSGCHIIPINPDGAFEGRPKDLPNEIELIKRIHISEMNMDTMFKESIQHIEETRIRKVADPKHVPKTQDHNSGKRYNLKIITDADCIISIDGYDCGICKANKVRVIELPAGSYVLDIVCIEEPIIRNTYDIEVTSDVIKRCSLKNAIEMAKTLDLFLIPYENEQGILSTKTALDKIKRDMKIAVLIGSEGGLSQKEIDALKEKGVI